MPKFEEQKGGYSREDYDKTEENEKDLKSQISGAKTADEMIEIATKLKKAEEKKSEPCDTAKDEAITENEEKTKQKEEYDTAHGEALVEDTERTKQKEEKKEEKEKAAKELEDLESQHNSLKEQVAAAKSADEILELAGKIKDIEKRKGELGGNTQEDQQKKQQEEALKSSEQLKGDANKNKEESAKKAEEILRKLNGGEKAEVNIEQEESESIKALRKIFEKAESGQADPNMRIYQNGGSKTMKVAEINKEYLSKKPQEYESISNEVARGTALSNRLYNSEAVIGHLLKEGIINEDLVIRGIKSNPTDIQPIPREQKIRALSVETLKQLSIKDFKFGDSLGAIFQQEVKKFTDLYKGIETKKFGESVRILADVQHLGEFMNKVSPKGIEQLKEQFNKSLESAKSNSKRFSEELYMAIIQDGGRSVELLAKSGVIPKETILANLDTKSGLAENAFKILLERGVMNSNEAVEVFKKSI